MIVKTSALRNLPMQPRRVRSVNLHAIDAEVMFVGDRIFSVNQRQSDEGPAVFLPRCEHRQVSQVTWSIDDFRYRPARDGPGAQLEKIAHQRSMFPKLRTLGRQ